MPSQGEHRQRFESIKSRLGEALLRLHHSLDACGREAGTDVLLCAWKSKWSGSRDQISHRLEVIESHLERLSGQAELPPRLTVLGDTSENKTSLPQET